MRFFKPIESDKAAEHYEDLVSGRRRSFFWGARLHDPDKAITSPSIQKHFTPKVSPLIKPEDHVLDLGCGTGLLLPVLSPLCSRLTGLEVSPVFVKKSRQVVEQLSLDNVAIQEGTAEAMPFGDETFDVIVAMDVLHHVCHLEPTLQELKRVLKPAGKLIVYEPNKLNVLLFILCLLDRNEWGLLSLGRKGVYRRVLGRHFEIERMEYNAVLVEPDSKLNVAIAEFLLSRWCRPWLGWMSPKIFMTLRHRTDRQSR